MAINPNATFKLLNAADLRDQSNRFQQNESNLASEELGRQRVSQGMQYAAEDRDVEQQLQKFDMAEKQINLVGQAIGSVTDQNSYSRAKQYLQQQGIDTSAYPDQYDPSVVKQAAMSTLSVKDRLESERQTLLNNANVALKGAQIGTEQAQQGNYGASSMANMALANQRNAAAGLNNANATRVQNTPIGVTPTSGAALTGTSASNIRPAKPLPIQAVKAQNELTEDLSIANNTQADLDVLVGQIDSGKLQLGPIANKANEARNYLGNSTEQSRNYQSFQSSLEKMRNDSLRLNKGVQTDGDAQRAWNELLTNVNDPQLVKQRLQEIKKINARGAELKKKQINSIRRNYNQEDIDASEYAGKASLGGTQDYKSMSDDDIRKSLGL